MEFCRDVGLPYALYGFVDGNKEVLGRLADVGRQAAILAQCQKAVSDGADFGHHTRAYAHGGGRVSSNCTE